MIYYIYVENHKSTENNHISDVEEDDTPSYDLLHHANQCRTTAYKDIGLG